MATDYFNLGQVCKEIKEYKLAEQYMKKTLGLANDMGSQLAIRPTPGQGTHLQLTVSLND